MILILHIIIALVSLVYTGYTYISPSKHKLLTSQILVAFTLGSGTYLVVATKAQILHACMMGLFYLGLTSAGIALAGRKMAAVRTSE